MLIEVVILLSLLEAAPRGFVRIAGQETPHREDRLRAAPIGTPSVGSLLRRPVLVAVRCRWETELKVHANLGHSKFLRSSNRLRREGKAA
jgi:hypothetical protein